MLERDYQTKLIKRIKSQFDGCVVLKNDPNYIQGVPDLIILCDGRWAALEVKVSAKSKKQPNQEYYVDKMNDMSYAAFIYPENEEEIFHGLQQALRPSR